MGIDGWIELSLKLGAIGVLAWVLDRLAGVIERVHTDLIPKLIEDNARNSAAQTERFKEIIDQQREDFIRADEQNRVTHIEAYKTMTERVASSQDKLSSMVAESIAERNSDRSFRRK